MKAGEITGRTTDQYGDDPISQRKVNGLIEKCRGCWTSVDDDDRPGRSSAVTCVEVKEQLDRCIWDNRKINIDKISSESSVGHERKRYKNDVSATGNMLFWWNEESLLC